MATTWAQLVQSFIDRGATPVDGDPVRVAAYGDVAAEYEALRDGPAIVDRSDRVLFEIGGADRATWLQNLTTNEVRNISPGEGNYAFALNVQGRILFDLNILVQSDSILLDIDRRWIGVARKHFDKYTITEDVTLADRTGEFVRLAMAGSTAPQWLEAVGVSQVAALPTLGARRIELLDSSVVLFRSDFCGPFAVELIVPVDRAVVLWESLAGSDRTDPAIPVGDQAVQAHRIESGIPWPGSEITDDLVPAETGQFDRAVSYRKGCYLGQEIVERMRSRKVLARRLCSLSFDGDIVPALGAQLGDADGAVVGRVTSAGRSPASQRTIGIGLVKTDGAEDGARLTASWPGASTAAVVAPLASATVGAH